MGNMYYGLVLPIMHWYEVPDFSVKSKTSPFFSRQKQEKIECGKDKFEICEKVK